MNAHLMNPLSLWPTVALVVAATVTDLRSRRIPNLLVLPFLLLGLAYSAFTHGWSGLSQSLLGILLAAAALGVFCFLGGMGMGDLKLFAAVGAWIGPSQLSIALVMTGIVGAVMALGWAVTGGFLNEALGNTAGLIAGRRKELTLASSAARKMPYAPAIAIGTILSFLGRHI
jgi:prepilin peptidase CpaA